MKAHHVQSAIERRVLVVVQPRRADTYTHITIE
jgi:hypothetical protein